MDNIQNKTLQTLKYLINFLDRYGLNYFICSGTAIGVVRHKGFIPWDDDIDIYMFRKDYEKLLGLGEEMYNDGYKIVNIQNNNNYYLKYSKVINCKTTLWEIKSYPCLLGSFVDIFPLDLCNAGMLSSARKWMEYNNVVNNYLKYIEYHSLSDYLKMVMSGQFLSVLSCLRYSFSSKKRFELKDRLITMERNFNTLEGNCYMSFTETGLYVYPKDWFSDYILMPFEDLQVKMPVGYHEYLTYMYGDYMKLPPKEERKSFHYHYYYNMEEGLDMNEVKKRIKKGK